MNAVTLKLILLFFMFSLIGQAQDTLFLKDKQKLIVQVKEVSQTEIQYKKIDLLDGPMYITSKNDIEKIIYKNGYTEIIKSETVPLTEKSFTVYKDVVDINTEKINYADTKNRYASLVRLIDRHPDPNRRSSLMQSAQTLRSLKRHQDGTRTGAIIFGGFAIGGTALYGLMYLLDGLGGVSDLNKFALPPIAFGSLALICASASIAININLRKKRHEFVNLYNQ